VTLDISTILAVTVFVSAIAGLLLLFSWSHNRSEVALGLWGIAFLMQGIGIAPLMLRQHTLPIWAIAAGPTILALAYGTMWAAARRFEGREVRLSAVLVGAAIWLAACQFEWFLASPHLRVATSSSIVVAYTLLCVRELSQPREPELRSRWPAMVLLLVHAFVFSLRIPLAHALPFPAGVDMNPPTWTPLGAFEPLFFSFCLAFLLVNMAKERVELEHRRAALIDPLTGVANRRAFLERGDKLLQRVLADDQTAALLVLDLDRFKEINDTHGHQTGDRVLTGFCNLATEALRPGDLFGRLGGEEFACLLPNTSLAGAVQIAERIRGRLAAVAWPPNERALHATVSVGVAVSSDEDPDLAALFVAADRALYRAKAAGRNRVEPTRAPRLVLGSARAAAAG
jgi:diguanylate cyclase (GGDEF)-like protein